MSDIPDGPIIKSPEGPVEEQPVQTDNNVLHVTNTEALSFTDSLLQVKGNVSVQICTKDINYLNFTPKDNLKVFMGSITFIIDTPNLTLETFKSKLSTVFHSLSIENNLLAVNQRRVSYYIFESETAMVVFKNSQFLRLIVGKEQSMSVFTSFAEHHEVVVRM